MCELTISMLTAVMFTVATGCVRASYVRQRSIDISQLSKSVRSDVEHCSDVYEELKESILPVASAEPCQQPGCGELSSMPGATKCDASPSAKRKDVERAVDAANQAKECARLSAQAAKQAQVAASTGQRQAYERGRDSVLPCTPRCEESRRRCDHALSEIDRVIDAADELRRKAR